MHTLTDGLGSHSHLSMMRRRAENMTGNRSEADDLVQDAMVRALIYRRRGHDVRNWEAYLQTIMRNLTIDESHRRRRQGYHLPLDEFGDRLTTQEVSQDDAVHMREVSEAIEALPADHRDVMLLVAVEGASYREAAARLSLPLGTVMSRLHRARASLRECLEEPKVGAGGTA